jgi:subtilisin family serine protease
VEPAAGRERIAFAMSVVHGHLVVIPADAARPVQQQKIDRRLFDVTGLIELGYHDSASTTVPLILRYRSAGAATRTKRAVTATGARVGRDLPAVRGVAVSAPKRKTAALWKTLASKQDSDVQTVWLDGRLQPALDVSVPQIGAPAAWQAGYTGKGMAVAVLDTGVDATHPDLAGRVTSSKNFTTEDNLDHVGHGTHVASTIAGDGKASGGKYKGVAPEAAVLSGKICEQNGCTDSAILAGMQWAAVDQHARVINMSLGGGDFAGIDPLEEALNALTAQTGALFVVAAGNEGPGDQTVGSPGSADAALTVGAVDKSDRTADFSSRGPRVGDEAIKPDIAAPGVDIVAARATGTEMGTPATDFPDTYQQASGTSMATPHVAGAAALLAQQHPDWAAGQLKAALMASAKPDPAAGPFEQGAGRVDVSRAINQTLTADPPSVSFGLAMWPHTDDVPVNKMVTYRNSGTADVTLDLTVAAPFTLGARTLSVPAGGTASVTVTADTRADIPDASYSGRLIATAGQNQVSTPVAVDKEAERYTLTLRHLGLDGKPTNAYLTQIFQPAGTWFELPYDPSGTITMRVPKGRYTTGSYVYTSVNGDNSQEATLFQPVLDITGDTTVTFDARQAVLVSQGVPERTAEANAATVSVSMTVDGAPVSYGTTQSSFAGLRVGEVGAGTPGQPAITGHLASGWAKRNSGDLHVDSPYSYSVAETVPGDQLLSGYHRRFSARELAADTHTVRPQSAGDVAHQWMLALDGTGELFAVTSFGIRAPGTRVNYYSTTPGYRWIPTTTIGTRADWGGIEGLQLYGDPHAYQVGERSRQEWGAAPYGTVLNSYLPWFSRNGDVLDAVLPQNGDAGGHAGLDLTQAVTTTLYRDGVKLDENDWPEVSAVDLPAQPATYRVEQTVQGGIGGLGTTMRSVFEFVSARPATDGDTLLPVFTVRYTPRLDRTSTAHGRTGRIPLAVRDQTGAAVTVRKLGLEVSYDDGATWRAAPVTGGAATVSYPSGAGFVSLRVHAEDAAGTSVTQTAIRAYRFDAGQ